jgi:adenylyltransferase/sulfurtransferase
MSDPKELILTEEALEEISRHARETFPEECCGVILNDGKTDEVRRCANIQNILHSLDPETYPRDATIAYAMDFKELELIMQDAERANATIKAFYHSHPGHEAYFSEEDKGLATPFGEPTFPDCTQIVISIYDRVVRDICAFAWMQKKQDFIQIPLVKVPSA